MAAAASRSLALRDCSRSAFGDSPVEADDAGAAAFVDAELPCDPAACGWAEATARGDDGFSCPCALRIASDGCDAVADDVPRFGGGDEADEDGWAAEEAFGVDLFPSRWLFTRSSGVPADPSWFIRAPSPDVPAWSWVLPADACPPAPEAPPPAEDVATDGEADDAPEV